MSLAHPAGWATAKDGTVSLRQYPGVKLAPGAKFDCMEAVYGVGEKGRGAERRSSPTSAAACAALFAGMTSPTRSSTTSAPGRRGPAAIGSIPMSSNCTACGCWPRARRPPAATSTSATSISGSIRPAT